MRRAHHEGTANVARTKTRHLTPGLSFAMAALLATAASAVPGITGGVAAAACQHKAVMFVDANYQGAYFSNCNGTDNVGSLWNDKITSFHVFGADPASSQRYLLEIWSDNGWQGCSRRFFVPTSDQGSLDQPNLENQTNTCDRWWKDWSDDITSFRFLTN